MFRLIFFFTFFLLSSCTYSGAKKNTPPNSSKTQKPPQQPFILPPPSYLSENLFGGKYIVLSDESVWIIKDVDTIFSSGWISAEEIYITLSDDPKYPYFLSTEASWAEVHAKKGTWNDIPLNRN